MSEIRFDGVSRRYDGVEALSGIDLRIATGDLHALVGPNGSGKIGRASCRERV